MDKCVTIILIPIWCVLICVLRVSLSLCVSGEHVSDNVMHAGGYGSLISSIGPSYIGEYAQQSLAANAHANAPASMFNPIASAFQGSLLNSGDGVYGAPTGGGITSGAGAGGGGVGGGHGDGGFGVVGGGGGPGGGVGPGVIGGGVGGLGGGGVGGGGGGPSGITPSGFGGAGFIPLSGGGFAAPWQMIAPLSERFPRDPYQGVAGNLGLGSLPTYATANDVIGPAYGGGLQDRWGLKFGFEEVSASTISSRINGRIITQHERERRAP